MDRFLDYIERYKFAILGTMLFHVLFFMTFNFVTVKSPYGDSYLYEEIELDADAIEMDEEMLEMLEKLALTGENSEQLYNLTADQNDQRERSYENFSAQEIDEQVEREARELEQQYFDDWAATHPNSDSPPPPRDSDLNEVADNAAENRNKANDNNVGVGGENAFAGPVMVSFNLKNRKAHSLANPGYTCNGAGTVVINIKVDKSGNVKSADFNSGLSRGATECMILKATRYAKKSRFDYSQSASGLESGTITYKFQGQ